MNPFLIPQYQKLLSAFRKYQSAVLRGIPEDGEAEPTQEMKDAFRELCAAYLPLKDEPFAYFKVFHCLHTVACRPTAFCGKMKQLAEIPPAEFDQWEILFEDSYPVKRKDAALIELGDIPISADPASAVPSFVRRVVETNAACCHMAKSLNQRIQPQVAKLLSALRKYKDAVLRRIPRDGKAEPTQEMKDAFKLVCAAYLPIRGELDGNLKNLQCLNFVECRPASLFGRNKKLAEVPPAEFDRWEILFEDSCPVTFEEAKIIEASSPGNSGKRLSAAVPSFVKKVAGTSNARGNAPSPTGVVNAFEKAYDAICEEINRAFKMDRIAEKDKPATNSELEKADLAKNDKLPRRKQLKYPSEKELLNLGYPADRAKEFGGKEVPTNSALCFTGKVADQSVGSFGIAPAVNQGKPQPAKMEPAKEDKLPKREPGLLSCGEACNALFEKDNADDKAKHLNNILSRKGIAPILTQKIKKGKPVKLFQIDDIVTTIWGNNTLQTALKIKCNRSRLVSILEKTVSKL